MSLLYDFALALEFDFLHKELDEPSFDSRILDYMVLELTVLHVLDEWQIELGHVVLIHVKKDITDHDDALLDFLPDAIELT